jgi:hypothetical protein
MTLSGTERESLRSRIYGINEKTFDSVAMDVWRYQYQYNGTYRAYIHLLGLTPDHVQELSQIPFLPVTMFRNHDVQTGNWEPQATFRSSGTTGSHISKHLIRDMSWYHKNATLCFEKIFGPPQEYAWIALLPSYLERPDSSLIDMIRYFMLPEGSEDNQFFSNVDEAVIRVLERLSLTNKKTILFGVTFALMDLFEKFNVPVWNELIVIETGGMKGRRSEITREELHSILSRGNHEIHLSSEYGMTEILSQAYMVKNRFQPGPAMRIRIRDISDPLTLRSPGQRGAINIIDLANLDTCSFIATDDMGIVYPDESFDVTGRLDQSDIRGCNLMYAE